MGVIRCIRRMLVDRTNNTYEKTSEWQLAKDVELENGKDVETFLKDMSADGSITEVKVVPKLPDDAANHPTTFYLIE